MAKRRQYSVAAARAALPGILNDVGAGEAVYLTRRGEPVAVVVSTRTYDKLRGAPTSFGASYRSFVDRLDQKKATGLEPSFFDGLRDRSPGRRVKL